MSRKAFNITVQGASHIEKGKPCQDRSGHYSHNAFDIVLVADGHGGDNYVRSDIGAQLAVESGLLCIREFIDEFDYEHAELDPEAVMPQLCKSIIVRWGVAVREHFAGNPFSQDELDLMDEKHRKRFLGEDGSPDQAPVEPAYGTTLLAAAVSDDYWFGLHIGDGRFVVKGYDGVFYEPIPIDEACFLNATTSLCDSNAISHFHYCLEADAPAAVFVCCDGVEDCFTGDESFYGFYDVVLASLMDTGWNKGIDDLSEYIPRMSKKGSGDDMSLAAIVDEDRLGEYVNNSTLESLHGTEPVSNDSTGNVDEDILGADAVCDDCGQAVDDSDQSDCADAGVCSEDSPE